MSSEVLENAAAVVAFIGAGMVIASVMARLIAKVLGLSRDDLRDPWYRSTDTSGMVFAFEWLKPGLVTVAVGITALVLADLSS